MYFGAIIVFFSFIGVLLNIVNLFLGIRPDDFVPKKEEERVEFGLVNILILNALKMSQSICEIA